MNKTCICIICHKPEDIWVQFLSQFTQYDIVLIVDDNSTQYSDYGNIRCIQVQEEDCKKYGYVDVNFLTYERISGWEKAVYYFAHCETNYDHIWFMEDDVFFYSEETIMAIDAKYPKSDLLTAPVTENPTGRRNWHWRYIKIEFPPPYCNAMVCAVRMSRTLLSKIRDYADSHNTLFFLEALFPTLCKYHSLVNHTPDEMTPIVHMARYAAEHMNKTHLFHPVKDSQNHAAFRELLR